MTQELAQVKTRIKALTEKTVADGCTEAEAMSAAELVGRLLERYALGVDEIEVSSARGVQVLWACQAFTDNPLCEARLAQFKTRHNVWCLTVLSAGETR